MKADKAREIASKGAKLSYDGAISYIYKEIEAKANDGKYEICFVSDRFQEKVLSAVISKLKTDGYFVKEHNEKPSNSLHLIEVSW